MGFASSKVCILVVEAPSGNRGIAAALSRLGDDARLEFHTDTETSTARARSGEVDVVVVDLGLGGDAERLMDSLRRDGPPAIVVDDGLSDDRALEWFRRGAADCVALEGGDAELLAVVVLEQIRRWRAIRERGAAENRIRELEHYSESVVQNMNSAVLVVDQDGTVTTSNAPAVEILGRRAEALLGQSVIDWFKDASGKGMLASTLADGRTFKGAESQITRPDGAVLPIGISIAPIADGNGVTHGAVATFQDLTGIQQLQRQVLQSEKMASIGQLAAGVAHEINNPMGFIHANLFQMAEYLSDLRRVWTEVELLQKAVSQAEMAEIRRTSERLAGIVDETDVDFLLTDLAKAIRESQEGSERIRHIVHDLRDFSYPDSGRQVVADVNQCLESTANIVWPMMKHLVVLEKEYSDLPAVTCFPMQLKQVFMNLLVNAYQAIEERLGDAAHRSGETGRIQLRTELSGNHVRISITDDGVGIDAANLDRIFDPFFTTKKVGSGTGLGLSTTYSIVQRHGGTIQVESTPDNGTTFRVLLPVDGADVVG